jgi:hypothetical protein
MDSVSQICEAIVDILTVLTERLGRETRFVQRASALGAVDFVQTVIFAWLQEPDITLNGLAQVLGRREVCVTPSAFSQRFGPNAAALLASILKALCAQVLRLVAVETPLLTRFSAVVLEDSSTIALPASLQEA